MKTFFTALLALVIVVLAVPAQADTPTVSGHKCTLSVNHTCKIFTPTKFTVVHADGVRESGFYDGTTPPQYKIAVRLLRQGKLLDDVSGTTLMAAPFMFSKSEGIPFVSRASQDAHGKITKEQSTAWVGMSLTLIPVSERANGEVNFLVLGSIADTDNHHPRALQDEGLSIDNMNMVKVDMDTHMNVELGKQAELKLGDFRLQVRVEQI